jgi:hypothetical protein
MPLGILSGVFLSGFQTKILYALLISAHLILIGFIILKFCEAPHYAILSSLLSLHPSQVKILFSSPCSQTPPMCSSLNVRDEVSYPYETKSKIIVSNIYLFVLYRREDKRYCISSWQAFLEFNLSLISS